MPSASRPVVAVLVTLAAVAACAAPAAAQEPTELVVVETASVRATPDAAVVGAAVERTARTPAAARRAVERRVRAILAALAGLGVPAADVRTTFFEAYTIRRRGRRRSQASRGIRIHVADLSKLEAVGAALGGSLSGEPEFIVSDPTDERAEATRIALQRARARADSAAAALGMRVIATVKVDLNPELGYGATPASGGQDESDEGGGGASGGGGVTVEAGQSEIWAAVAVVYEIGP